MPTKAHKTLRRTLSKYFSDCVHWDNGSCFEFVRWASGLCFGLVRWTNGSLRDNTARKAS